ncbi:uncharacterized protein IL334_002439 [Kwoniella shivajii]|uniref:C3H1-type domain-containing protein n=1 Tax=Kwoniella shivajii TaxID=564305 RepID=A0ABZ1CXU2_9TREE|nr:hypothetical protein IL334_002439 [Kwoniella shivajii]
MSSSPSPAHTPSSPHTPPPSSPTFKLILPTPPSFLAHRSRSSESTNIPRNTSTNDLNTSSVQVHDEDQEDEIVNTKYPYPSSKRLSISSIDDPIVQDNEKRDQRRVSFSVNTNTSTDNRTISRPISIKSSSFQGSHEGGLKSPLYKIPQRQSTSQDTNNTEELIDSPDISDTQSQDQNQNQNQSTHIPKRRPISFQGISPSSPITNTNTSPSRFASTAAARGISIAPSLSKGGAFRSIWSAGIIPSTKSGWMSPPTITSPPTSAGPSISQAMRSAASLNSCLNSPTTTIGTATVVAKARGLSIAIIKEGGKGVVPITPGLTSAGTGLKSPIGTGMKSPDAQVIRGGLESAQVTAVPDTAASNGKKEIILCKFYHTPGLTCTSRPCRFVHNLSAIVPTSATPATASGYLMLSPTQPDPTSGTFAQAQMTLSEQPSKTLKISDNMDLGDVMPGEKVLVKNENCEEVVGQVFLMSGGGKGAMGKSREKWKTVPCKDYAEGRCPYGDYCSFIHDEKLPSGLLTEDAKAEPESKPANAENSEEQKKTKRLTHRKSASLSSSLSAWTRALPKAMLVPSVKFDPQALKKIETGLSAFAPPFLKEPLLVDQEGGLVNQSTLSAPRYDTKASSPPARPKEPVAIPMEPTATAPPKINLWAKGPPPSLRKLGYPQDVSLPSHELSSNLATLQENQTPTSARHLMPPVSAISMFGTESDPASPFDPVVQRRKMQELEDALNSQGDDSMLPKSNLSHMYSNDLFQPLPSPPSTYNGNGSGFNSTSYPWGMPMSPLPGHQDPSVPLIPGGLGVMWTPAGWAVQDAAMKNALRSAEVKAKYGEDVRRRTAKNYFRTRPCKFFAEGFCPHGAECTYMHFLTPPSPDQSSSGSDSGDILSFSAKKHPKHQTLPCKFFNSSSGCHNGSSCAFLHTRVVPESVSLVERPRPWRTKPCRHYQLGRCSLGDACHFAHVSDPAWINSGINQREIEGNGGSFTEESLERTMEEMRRNARQWREEDDGEDDDVEIVTTVGNMTFSSQNYSPSSSGRK